MTDIEHPKEEVRLLWFSNSTHMPTGYGKPTKLICNYLWDQGWDIMVLGQQTFNSPVHHDNGLVELPVADADDQRGNIASKLLDWDRNALVMYLDMWNFPMEFFQRIAQADVEYIYYGPVSDHHPISPYKIARMQKPLCDLVVSQSEHGASQVAQYERTPDQYVIPAPVDREVFQPREFPRKDEKFRVVSLKMNKGIRHNLASAMRAYKWFIKENDLEPEDTEYYIHTHPAPDYKNCYDLNKLRSKLGLEDYVRFPNEVCRECDGPTKQTRHGVPRCVYCGSPPLDIGLDDGTLAKRVYNRGHVFFNPAMSEGFGVNLAEALACGVPTMNVDWPTGDERTVPDLLIDVEHVWTDYLLSERAFFSESHAMHLLSKLYHEDWFRDNCAETAYEMGKLYDKERVLPAWEDVMVEIANRRYEKRMTAWGGLYADGDMVEARPSGWTPRSARDLVSDEEDLGPVHVPTPRKPEA